MPCIDLLCFARGTMKRNTMVFVLVLLAIGCNAYKPSDKPVLANEEKRICDSLKIDTMLFKMVKKYTIGVVEPFHYSLGKLFENGMEKEIDPIHANGIVFKATAKNTEVILADYHELFKGKGYSLFILEQNFAIKNEPDVMAILNTTDKYEILKQIKTDGINYDIDNDSLIKLIRIFDDTYSLDLIGAGGDWCQFTINKKPDDWMEIAKEAYAICPDIVDQGTGTVEALADEMKRTNCLYFWWD